VPQIRSWSLRLARRGRRGRFGLAGAGLLAATAALALVTSAAANAVPDGAAANVAPGGLNAKSPSPASSAKPLAGKIIGIDPGHNGRNYTDPAFLDKQIWNGRELEDCDTTGTETDGGYTEAKFNWIVANDLAKILRKEGAKVVLTRHSNDGVGPCVNTRARILDRAHADVSIDIHADGGPASGRGFTVLEPVADGPNDKVIKSSERFGKDVHQAFLADTPMMVSDYYGKNGYIFRNDLAGLNLTTMPKVLIECGNMRNSADAKLLTALKTEREIAVALSAAIKQFLAGH
jgi:N-acetylmuramoyl-L-alanine amidase